MLGLEVVWVPAHTNTCTLTHTHTLSGICTHRCTLKEQPTLIPLSSRTQHVIWTLVFFNMQLLLVIYKNKNKLNGIQANIPRNNRLVTIIYFRCSMNKTYSFCQYQCSKTILIDVLFSHRLLYKFMYVCVYVCGYICLWVTNCRTYRRQIILLKNDVYTCITVYPIVV